MKHFFDLHITAEPAISKLVDAEKARQQETVDLIASENLCSPAVLKLTGSVLTNKYAEGYPYARYYDGCAVFNQVELLAQQRLKKLFACANKHTTPCRQGGAHANVQPYSGSQANIAVYLALLKPGDTVLSMKLSDGGHLSHGAQVNFSGRYCRIIHYGVDPVTHLLDYQAINNLALKHRPKVIIAGASAYSRVIDWAVFRKIADQVGALLWCDVAHIAGLIVAKQHPNPCCFADVVTLTTHKTLRGPRGGAILTTTAWAKKIDQAVFPGTQGGPPGHTIAAKAQAFWEAMQPHFIHYQKQIIANSQALARVLMQHQYCVISGGTDNHLLLVNTFRSPCHLTGAQAIVRLSTVGIVANKNMMPGDQFSPQVTSGVRFGTPAMTTRGWDSSQFTALGALIVQLWNLSNELFEQQKDYWRQQVATLLQEHTYFYH